MTTQTDSSGQSEDLSTVVRTAIQRARDEHEANGAIVAVVADGETVLTDGYGHAYRNPDVPVDATSTLFRIGSVSKVFPYVAAMRLVDENRVDPHAPVSESLESVSVPDSDTYDEPITLAHLATHTTGFTQRTAGQYRTSPDEVRSLPAALRANDPDRVHPPGELSMYTNYNAGLAGQLAADVQGVAFSSAIRSLVFEPVGMTESTFDPLPDALVGGRSDASEEINWYSEMTPASGLSTTATDMARFLRAVAGDGTVEGSRLLSPQAVAALHRQWHTPHEQLAGASFGMERQRRDGTLVVGHQGAIPDFRSDLRVVPDEGAGLFVSVHGPESSAVQEAVTDAFLDHVAPVSEPTRPSNELPTRGEEITGRYRAAITTDLPTFEKSLSAALRPATSVHLAESGELVTERRGTTHRWVEIAPLVFRRTDGADTLVFRANDAGGFYLFRARQPRIAVELVPWYEQPGLHGKLALAAGAVALSGAVGWPLAAAWRRLRGGDAPSEAITRGRWTASGSVLVLLLFGFLSLLAVAERWHLAPPPWFDLVFALPAVGVVLGSVSARYTVRAWHSDDGTLSGRLHLTAVSAGLGTLYGLLWYWNLFQISP